MGSRFYLGQRRAEMDRAESNARNDFYEEKRREKIHQRLLDELGPYKPLDEQFEEYKTTVYTKDQYKQVLESAEQIEEDSVIELLDSLETLINVISFDKRYWKFLPKANDIASRLNLGDRSKQICCDACRLIDIITSYREELLD